MKVMKFKFRNKLNKMFRKKLSITFSTVPRGIYISNNHEMKNINGNNIYKIMPPITI